VTVGEIEVNGAEIHYELRGSGPRLLFIPGAEGDAEEYLRVVVALEDRFSILSYDRRAFSRSARPADYVGTTVEQQADDAAALMRALNFAPASVWGNSSGAIIGLSLVLRHPDVVETAMLHEPPLFAGMNDWQSQLAFLQEATAEGKVPFLRMLTGDDVYNSLSEAYRARLETDRTWIDHEFDVFEYYRPSDEELANITRPVKVLYGADSPPFFGEAAHWLAGRLGSGRRPSAEGTRPLRSSRTRWPPSSRGHWRGSRARRYFCRRFAMI
jgi:pimeloyl-ACP methyl ester carboxylesterase